VRRDQAPTRAHGLRRRRRCDELYADKHSSRRRASQTPSPSTGGPGVRSSLVRDPAGSGAARARVRAVAAGEPCSYFARGRMRPVQARETLAIDDEQARRSTFSLSTVCGRRACRGSRGLGVDPRNNPCRRQADVRLDTDAHSEVAHAAGHRCSRVSASGIRGSKGGSAKPRTVDAGRGRDAGDRTRTCDLRIMIPA
jgi:hypothetical protein